MSSPPPDDLLRPPRSLGWALSFLGLLPLGCERGAPPPLPAVEAPAQYSDDSARATETAALLSWLRDAVVTEDRFFVPRVFYTWTRAEQIAELRRDRVLLTRDRGRGGERSAFDHALDRDGSPVAVQLRQPLHRARRFAWPVPWATRRAWPGADYGDRLIRVELRPEAWIARFDPDAPESARWDVRDADGTPVDPRSVATQPWRIGAIYHRGRGPGPDRRERVFREYVLVSETMIARFSVGTADIVQRLARDRVELAVLEERMRTLGVHAPPLDAWTQRLPARWSALRADAEIVELYEAALALGSEHYVPTPDRIAALFESLLVPMEDELLGVPERPRPPRIEPITPVHCDPTMGCWPR